jgi:hypothetical protein
MMVTRYSLRCVWLCAKADGTDMRRLPAVRAVQRISLIEVLCLRLTPANMAEVERE